MSLVSVEFAPFGTLLSAFTKLGAPGQGLPRMAWTVNLNVLVSTL